MTQWTVLLHIGLREDKNYGKQNKQLVIFQMSEIVITDIGNKYFWYPEKGLFRISKILFSDIWNSFLNIWKHSSLLGLRISKIIFQISEILFWISRITISVIWKMNKMLILLAIKTTLIVPRSGTRLIFVHSTVCLLSSRVPRTQHCCLVVQRSLTQRCRWSRLEKTQERCRYVKRVRSADDSSTDSDPQTEAE